MKVALVIPYNPLEEVGGLEIGTMYLARDLRRCGVEPIIITKGQTGASSGLLILGFSSLTRICKFLLSDHESFDVIHWLEIFPGPGEVDIQLMASGLLRSLGKKVVMMVATSGNLRNRASGEVSRLLLQFCLDAYVISNPDQLMEFSEAGLRLSAVHQIGFGVEAKKTFTPVGNDEKVKLRQELGLPPDKILCLFMGRFVERKQPDFLLRAWQTMTDLYDQAELVIVGSGMQQHDSIESAVFALAENAKFAHFHEVTKEPQKYYQACDILLLPSDREGQPNVLLEAMACGQSVIASDIAGIREMLINGVNGLTFPPHDEASFISAIHLLVNDRALRSEYGQSARQTILERKNLPLVTEEYLALYNKIERSQR
ncbi:MAG: glycosyltransferase family 4 protein [Patescibacteria group bacterium]